LKLRASAEHERPSWTVLGHFRIPTALQRAFSCGIKRLHLWSSGDAKQRYQLLSFATFSDS